MTLKSAARRGTIATVAFVSALGLAACSSGQISQTADQVAAVDGAQNEQPAIPGGIAIRDAQVVIDPGTNDAALKFTAVNQERSDITYTLKSVSVEGAGDVKLSPKAKTKGAAGYDKQDLEIPHGCSLVATTARDIDVIAEGAEDNGSCINYLITDLDSSTLVGSDSSAAGLNRTITFTFADNTGKIETIEVFSTVSAYIPDAGSADREHRDRGKEDGKHHSSDHKTGEHKNGEHH
ncbi:hypothetical protein KRX51_08260 [Corynebacterium sp. TAE3-ERU12]|uniref:hypothetical protein n=1 Tax=Corynebacterium sp. TAE3-ERU12 TaxID=2849491 RepID=UPI001C479040|nr:hypothetical protein [Corynebacterium sp. TAE3-ERU12]MBV7295900.1 hypothetical protein [Corynebacterium sp. TAE3-ERU12]